MAGGFGLRRDEARVFEELSQIVLAYRPPGKPVDEGVQTVHVSVWRSELIQHPVRGRLDERQASHALGVGERELDQRAASARPSGEMSPLDSERVQREPERLALRLGVVAEIAGLPGRAQLVVNRLNADRLPAPRKALS